MIATIITFFAGIALNVLFNVHHFDNFKVNDKIKTYSLHVTAEKDIDIGAKKIDEVFAENMNNALGAYKIKSKETEGDVDITVNINKFSSEKVLGTDDKIKVSIEGKVSLKNTHDDDKSFKDKSFHESIEVDEKDKEKNLVNAKKIIESYCKKFIEENLG